MAEDLEDVDAMLEAAFQQEDGSRDQHSSEASHKDVDRQNGHSKDRRDREKDESGRTKRRSRSRDRAHRSETSRHRSRDRERRRSRSRDRRRSRSRERRRHRSRERPSRDSRKSRSRSKDRASRQSARRSNSNEIHLGGKKELTAEERDARTVFCMQLSARIKARELEEFFSVVGKVTDVRIITDAKTRRSKGIAYVEFEEVESVPLALGLGGQKLLGVPIVVQPTLAERNRAASVNNPETPKAGSGPMRLYVGSLHFNITEEMLKSIFEPFGKIDVIQLIMDTETQRSKGYGFVTFHNSDDAKKALEQLNGFELAGRPMKVNHVTDRNDAAQTNSLLDLEERERSGVELGATQRLQLMAKLAEGTGLELPPAAVSALQMPPQQQQAVSAPAIATQCFLLSNMFDPVLEQAPNWSDEIADDVVLECRKHGAVLHVFVDRQSAQGNVYVKCASIATAVASVTALHGRWFAGKMITAAYVPLLSYHSLFPDSATAAKPL